MRQIGIHKLDGVENNVVLMYMSLTMMLFDHVVLCSSMFIH